MSKYKTIKISEALEREPFDFAQDKRERERLSRGFNYEKNTANTDIF